MDNVFSTKCLQNVSVAKYKTISSRDMKKRRVAIIIAGLMIGVVNGLFGAGGGMITVPCLTYICGLDEKRSHATAIAIILPLCLISTIVYGVSNTFDVSIIIPTVIGVTIGSIIGALLLKKMSNNALSTLFYALMLLAGFKMIFDTK